MLIRKLFNSPLMIRMAGIVRASRRIANSAPKNFTSNKIMGILIEAQTQRKTQRLNKLAPFFRRASPTGKAA